MSRNRLHAQIARMTGESLRTIRSQGFSLLTFAVPIEQPAPRLCLACPGCGSEVALTDDDGELPEWAECPHCDIAYPYDDEEVFLPDTELDLELACA